MGVGIGLRVGVAARVGGRGVFGKSMVTRRRAAVSGLGARERGGLTCLRRRLGRARLQLSDLLQARRRGGERADSSAGGLRPGGAGVSLEGATRTPVHGLARSANRRSMRAPCVGLLSRVGARELLGRCTRARAPQRGRALAGSLTVWMLRYCPSSGSSGFTAAEDAIGAASARGGAEADANGRRRFVSFTLTALNFCSRVLMGASQRGRSGVLLQSLARWFYESITGFLLVHWIPSARRSPGGKQVHKLSQNGSGGPP